MASKFERFAALHVPGDPVVLYNIWDVGSALAVEKAGAMALATGSSYPSTSLWRTRSASPTRPTSR